jgi:thioredoxin 1
MVQELTPKTFSTVISKGNVVVDFWAPWCGPCRMMAPVFEEVSKEQQTVTFAKVDVNEQENESLAAQFNVQSIPTLIFFKDGKVVDTVMGAMPKQTLSAKVSAVFKK